MALGNIPTISRQYFGQRVDNDQAFLLEVEQCRIETQAVFNNGRHISFVVQVNAMSVIVFWLVIVAFFSLSIPRITPPGGLTSFDFLLMASLPIAAFYGGRRSYSGSAYLIYGGLGMLIFVPGFLSNGRLGLGYAFGVSSPAKDITFWVIGTLGMVLLCRLFGQVGHKSVGNNTGRHEIVASSAAATTVKSSGSDFATNIKADDKSEDTRQ
jgi:hypothetical protein